MSPTISSNQILLGPNREEGQCPALMRGGRQCGRELASPGDTCCVMHVPGEKDLAAFCAEILRMGAVGDADFSQFIFPPEFDFSDFAFEGPVSFAGATFGGPVYFARARFAGVVDFSAFSSDHGFRPTLFLGPALFTEARFTELAMFGATHFYDLVSFMATSFEGGAYFGGYWFQAGVEIPVTFHKAADFRKAKVELGEFANRPCGLFLPGCHFRGRADFRGCQVNAPINLEFAVFEKEALFTEMFVSQCDDHEWVLAGATFIEPHRAVFSASNFQRAILRNVDVTRVRLVDVQWPRRRDGTRYLWDEERRSAQEEKHPVRPAELAETYRQLKLNYEEARSYDIAGDFHVGEMEVRRRAVGGRFPILRDLRRLCSVVGLYHLVSGYGENYRRAALWVLLAPVAFAVAYWLCMGFNGQSPSFEAALFFSVERAIRLPQTTHPAWEYPLVARWIGVVEAAIYPVLIALLALAIRRRFHR